MTNAISDRARWLASEVVPHERALRSMLRRKRFSEFDVEDLVQDTYVALASLDCVDHIDHPRSYTLRAATSIALNRLRREKIVSIGYLAELETVEFADDAPSPERQACDAEELRRVREALSSLNSRTQEIFALRRIHGLSQREVSQQLGISEGIVAKHVGRGQNRLTRVFPRGRDFRPDH